MCRHAAALSGQVRKEFAAQPGVYSQFVSLMSKFKNGQINEKKVVEEVVRLFQGKDELIMVSVKSVVYQYTGYGSVVMVGMREGDRRVKALTSCARYPGRIRFMPAAPCEALFFIDRVPLV